MERDERECEGQAGRKAGREGRGESEMGRECVCTCVRPNSQMDGWRGGWMDGGRASTSMSEAENALARAVPKRPVFAFEVESGITSMCIRRFTNVGSRSK
eukprot:2756818-Rhodomonas_salina.1